MERAILATTLIGIAAVFIFEALRRDEHRYGQRCSCSHRLKEHVSAWDWDSDFGDPRGIGPDYRKPGTCRRCICRSFHAR